MSKPGPIAQIREGVRLLKGLRSNPNIGQELRQSRMFRRLTRALPPKVLQHYLYPLVAGRGASAYDAERFFSSFYALSSGGLSDSSTLSPIEDPITSSYHYAVTEKALIECLTRHEVPRPGSVLDVGSGAGHWIAFYRELYGPDRIVGVDIVAARVRDLRASLAGDDRIEILQGDVSQPDFHLGEHFDLVNAIGVMFHIVEDEAWERALSNLASHLAPRGRLVVGGQFGRITANVQFHGRDDFGEWGEGAESGAWLVNKRIRSLRRWRRTARRCGLRVVGVRRTHEIRSLYTPENNILLLEKSR